MSARHVVARPLEHQLVLGLLDEDDVAHRQVVAAAARAAARRRVQWHLGGPGEGPVVLDLTRGARCWPLGWCMARSGLVEQVGQQQLRAFVCTRIAAHTGRHAAGDGLRVHAVWGRGFGR
ncbi:hypothetical protein ACTHAM_002384 [Cellulomonas soli]|uniref:hypothetical protein n=1 Tax=Cellulomonas soli TaxID=931535 RepID=UPI003F84539A